MIALHIQKIEENPASWSGLHRFGLGLYFFVFGIVIMGLPVASYLIFGTTALLLVSLMNILLIYLLSRVWKGRKEAHTLSQHLATFGFGVYVFAMGNCIAYHRKQPDQGF